MDNDIATIYKFSDLLQLAKNYSQKELDLITKAFEFASTIHLNQSRQSGIDQVAHVLTVAKYIMLLNLDSVSIISALLHDSIEKTNISIDLIDKEFGTDVAFIVQGVSQIRKISSNVEITKDSVELEEFKKLIFNATEDVRVLIIRLAEKLHNLVDCNSLSIDLQKRAAERGLKIYAPLAEYLGLNFFQNNIEEISFKILKPKEYSIVKEEIDKYFFDSKELFATFQSEMESLLNEYKILYSPIKIRKKSIYSAYLKAKRKFLKNGEELNSSHIKALFDIYAARIIVEKVEDCYLILGLVQSKYGIFPEEFNDYISNPKPNGYKSIHLLISYMNTTLELQIRTIEMHNYNEFGAASHVIYKLKSKGESGSFTLTEDLIKWKDSSASEKFKIKLFAESVFVFTPKGLVIRLEKGCTPIDFAFRIHTDIGYKYVGAKVNGKMVSMDYKLQTGDVVEIITQKKDNVSLGWLDHAFSSETKARIKKRF